MLRFLFVHMCRDNMCIHPFLTNLEDEISVKGGRICKAQNLYQENNNYYYVVFWDYGTLGDYWCSFLCAYLIMEIKVVK
jgi:hypothetical protein